MIGPQGSSLLHKLGKKMACEMGDAELQAIVAADQQRRTIERALGRTKKVLEEQDDDFKLKKPGRPRTKSRVKKDGKPPPQTLEGFGLATELCQKLRATGKPDWQLILELQGAGLI